MPRAITDPKTPKPGRGNRRSDEPASRRIFCRLTEKEYAAIMAICELRGQTLAELIRDCLAVELGTVARRPVERVVETRPAVIDEEAVVLLRRAGGLLKGILGRKTLLTEVEVATIRKLMASTLKAAHALDSAP